LELLPFVINFNTEDEASSKQVEVWRAWRQSA